MSRAFVKELDGDQIADDLPELPQSSHPNYITPEGFTALQRHVAKLQMVLRGLKQDAEDLQVQQQRRHTARDLRWQLERLNRAIVVDLGLQPRHLVAFGAKVTVSHDSGVVVAYRIVGEDETNLDEGQIGWTSPLAQALLNREVDDEVLWKRPAGDQRLTIVAIDYPPAS